jgi:hypothetical protein
MVDGLRDRKGKLVKEGLEYFFVECVCTLLVFVCGRLLCVAVVRGDGVRKLGFLYSFGSVHVCLLFLDENVAQCVMLRLYGDLWHLSLDAMFLYQVL